MVEWTVNFKKEGGIGGIYNEVIMGNMLEEITVKTKDNEFLFPYSEYKDKIWNIIESHKILELNYVSPGSQGRDTFRFFLRIDVEDSVKEIGPWWDDCDDRPKPLKLIEETMQEIIDKATTTG